MSCSDIENILTFLFSGTLSRYGKQTSRKGLAVSMENRPCWNLWFLRDLWPSAAGIVLAVQVKNRETRLETQVSELELQLSMSLTSWWWLWWSLLLLLLYCEAAVCCRLFSSVPCPWVSCFHFVTWWLFLLLAAAACCAFASSSCCIRLCLVLLFWNHTLTCEQKHIHSV